MPRRLCAVLLAAGEGTRLRPLTDILPKALCPIANVSLLDRALAAVATLGLTGPDNVAANAWYKASEIEVAARFDGFPRTDRFHVNVEHTPRPLGSSGGLAALRDWIDGRDVVVGNADAYLTGGDLAGLTRDWTGDEVRMLGTRAPRAAIDDFGAHRFAGFSVLPWRWVATLAPEPTDLVRTVWRPAQAARGLRIVAYAGRYIDCGTPSDYLAANLTEAAGHNVIASGAVVTGSASTSVIGAGARVDGDIVRTVVWPGATVHPGERLREAIRYGPDRADTITTALA